MSTKPLDQRPKVVSFHPVLDGLDIAASESVLWPCHSFNISIQKKKNSGLNLFEETVLKITEIDSGDTDEIALFTCLKRELVEFIQNRLNQLGLLNDRYELSEQGQNLLNEWQGKSGGNFEFDVATVFVDLLSGHILPYIHAEQLSYKKISRIHGKIFIDFLNDFTNEKSRVSARRIQIPKDAFWNTVPDANDIINAIREFKKKYKRYALLNQRTDQHPPPVFDANTISLHEDPELIYLHCKAVIQKGNPDLLVTDGFGFGFSESFSTYLTDQDSEWVIGLMEKGVIKKPSSSQNYEKTECKTIASDEFKEYPSISRPIKRAKRHLLGVKDINVNSSYKEQGLSDMKGESVVALYEAIEWALKFIVSDNPVTHWEHVFKSQSYRENDRILQEFASKIGFDDTDSVKSLLQVKPGKIRAIDRGVSEMQPLLALAIAGANCYPNHPFLHLAVEDSGCLSFINTLKAVRDPVSHGNSTDIELSSETLECYYNRTVRLIQSLIPNLTEDVYTVNTMQVRDIDQVRYEARTEISKSLGLGFVQAVSPSLREELVKVTILGQNPALDNEQVQRYIISLASIMQLSLFEVAKDRRLSVNKLTNLRDEAIEKICQSGFYPAHDVVPEQISTVNPDRLVRAVQGSPRESLGAQLLAVFQLGSVNELNELRKSAPEFVVLVADLIRLRGHGNNQQSNLSGVDLELIKCNVFGAIKILAEVF